MARVTLSLARRKGSCVGTVSVYGPEHISGAACYEHRPRGDRLSWHRGRSRGTGYRRSGSRRSGPRRRCNASRGPETQEATAPMSCTNPTGGGRAVALTIPPADAGFLRRIFGMALGSIRDDLDEYADVLPNPGCLRREESVYEALLAALDSGSVVVSDDMRCLLCDLAVMIDRENEYERVVAEHAALLGLRRQVNAGAAR